MHRQLVRASPRFTQLVPSHQQSFAVPRACGVKCPLRRCGMIVRKPPFSALVPLNQQLG
jgi:hypothetical protein